MGTQNIQINGTKIAPGESTRLTVNLARLPSGTRIELPIYVFRSKNKGPTVLLTGGIHGDEINGVEIVRRMLDKSHFDFLKKGSVVALPVTNIYGFLNFSREVPDGKDINRSFPGHAGGSLASRVAQFLHKKILTEIDYGVDFHTGGASRFNFPQVRYAPNDKQAAKLAKAFAPPVIMKSKLIDRSFRKQGHKMNKSIIVYEGGESMRLDEDVVQEGINGTMRLLRHLKMIDHADSQAAETVYLKGSSWVRAHRSGIYTGLTRSGMTVGKGDTLGLITDPFGEFEIRMKAPKAGFIIGHNNMPVINQGDALIHLGLME